MAELWYNWLESMERKLTKIIATISDRKYAPDFIASLHEAGADVMRLNTAHQTLENTLKIINSIRKVSDRIAILIDTKGPEVRVAGLEAEIFLKKGCRIEIAGYKRGAVSSEKRIYANYSGFPKNISAGSSIFIDNGKIELKVEKKLGNVLFCRVLNEGIVKPFKSINAPGIKTNLPSLAKKDEEYLKFSVKHKIDFIAHSFVRNKKDIFAIQKMVKGSKIKIIAKIENREGVENINEIIDHAYGIMIARGDMGIEMPAEEIPLLQKEIIRKCISNRKPVIVATQMLQSMINSPRPTRAEVSDVANAVIDGADAVMLSDESATGDYPIEAVKTLSKILARVESGKERYLYKLPDPIVKDSSASFLMKSAVSATKEMDIKQILMADPDAFEVSILASLRGRTPIFFKCYDRSLVRQLSLTYGVEAEYTEKSEGIPDILRDLVKRKRIFPEDKIIILSSGSSKGSEANSLEISQVKKIILSTGL